LNRQARKILSIGLLPVFIWALFLFVGRSGAVWAADDAAEKTGTLEGEDRSEEGRTGGGEPAPNRDVERLKEKAGVMIGTFEEERCRKKEMVRYHGKCMKTEERDTLFELEIRHVESLLNDAIALYETATAEDIDWVFHRADQFAGKFEADEVMDERIEEKLLLLLAFTHKSADRLAKSMKSEMNNAGTPEGAFAFLERYGRTEAFLNQVCIPLMRLLGKQMDAYAVRHGRKKLEKLLANNSLGDILSQLE